MLGMVAVIGSLAGSLAFAADPPPAPGSLDRSFLPAVTRLPSALTLQPDGRLLVGGLGSLARYEVSGAPDPSFNPTVGTFDFIQAIALRADGTMLLGGGGLSSPSQIVALNPNGQPMAEIPPAFDGDVHQILVQADDGILVAGGFTYAAEKLTDVRGRIARLEPVEGHFDTGFDPGLGADGTIFALALDDQGRILAGGAFTNFDRVPMAGIARLSPQGRLDPGFTPRLNDGDVQDIAVQSDGRILIVGNFTRIEDQPAGGLARLLPDGRLDTSFHPVVEFTRIAPELKGWALAITAENRILVGGPFTQVNGESRSYLAELNPAGELVPAFTGRLDRIPWLFALRPNGRIVIGGNFDTVEGANRPYVAQLFGHSDENLSPTIVHQPEDQAVPVGATAVFRVLAEGSAPLEYQWWFQNTNSIPSKCQSSLLTLLAGSESLPLCLANCAGNIRASCIT